MSKIFILLFMIMMHIVDDYYLQGILAKMKQKSWWEENAPNKLYKKDYLMALFMHAFSWAFMIMLPIAINLKFEVDAFFTIMLGINFMIHAIVDNFKANEFKINLIQDQIIHIIQILITFAVFCSRMNVIAR